MFRGHWVMNQVTTLEERRGKVKEGEGRGAAPRLLDDIHSQMRLAHYGP